MLIGLLVQIPIWIAGWAREHWFLVSCIAIASFWLCVKYWAANEVKRERRKQRLRAERNKHRKALYRRSHTYLKSLSTSRIDEIDAWPKEEKGIKFEDLMAVYFESQGCDVRKTKGSGDFGVDLLVYNPKTRRTAAVQCKCYDPGKSKVGTKAVQEVSAGLKHYKADYPMVVTNSWLTKNAKVLARTNKVHFWERDDLVKRLARIDGNCTDFQ